MSDWLRRNRWYLIALVVLVPAAIVVALVPRWFPYQQDQPQPEVVARGETANYSGAEISLRDLEILDGEEWNAPLGADIVVATLSIDVLEATESTRCDIAVVSVDGDLERFWPSAIGDVGDYDIPDELSGTCSFSTAGAYELQLGFEVPAGQVTAPSVQISSSIALPRVLRLN
jgi:hypothetical protein